MSDPVPVFVTPDDSVWARGPFRAQVWRSGSRWKWHVWDVVSVGLGGSGFRVKGVTRTKGEAERLALAMLETTPGRPTASPGSAGLPGS